MSFLMGEPPLKVFEMEWLGISVLQCVGTCTILTRYGQWTKEGFQAARYPIEMAGSLILGYGILGAPQRGARARERQVSSIKPSTLVTTGEEFDPLTSPALPALFYHLYGLGQSHVVRLLGLGPAESQRLYKNFERWRRTGWLRFVEEVGLTDVELHDIEDHNCRYPEQLTAEINRLLSTIQAHYRKSEPEHFPCLTGQQWAELFGQGYGYDYRVWHLALCRECLVDVHAFRQHGLGGIPTPRVDLHVRPL